MKYPIDIPTIYVKMVACNRYKILTVYTKNSLDNAYISTNISCLYSTLLYLLSHEISDRYS